MDEYGDFGDFGGVGADIAGPLIGGGATQVGMIATKLMFKGKPITKWAGAIGALLGSGISAALFFTGRRSMGIQGIVTSLLIGVPRLVEDQLLGGSLSDGYLGVITPEQEMAGYFGQQQDIQMLGGGGAGVLGVTVPEQSGFGAGDVELLGAGFGSNFLSSQ
jgi:hypothetical protein